MAIMNHEVPMHSGHGHRGHFGSSRFKTVSAHPREQAQRARRALLSLGAPPCPPPVTTMRQVNSPWSGPPFSMIVSSPTGLSFPPLDLVQLQQTVHMMDGRNPGSSPGIYETQS